jgi:imidazolonepropionase-like amidohydrolase
VRRLAGSTLLPGLIDSHSHVSIVPSRGDQLGQMRLPAEVQLATARSNVLADLLSGVTTLRVMGQELDVDFLLRDEIASGATLGPDLVCAGVQVTKDGAHGHALTAVRNEAEIDALVERNVAQGAGLVKIFTTGVSAQPRGASARSRRMRSGVRPMRRTVTASSWLPMRTVAWAPAHREWVG